MIFYIALIIFVIILMLYIIMVLIRKSLWDTVHRNLLDIEDNYDGKVIRTGFASRPVFKGVIKGSDVTINFSTARSKSGRKFYIDFSFTNALDHSLTIAEKGWLEEQGNNDTSLEETISLKNDYSYVIMSSEKKKVHALVNTDHLKQLLGEFDNLAYFFVGKAGTICEFWSDQIDRDTQFEKMKSRLENVYLLLDVLK